MQDIYKLSAADNVTDNHYCIGHCRREAEWLGDRLCDLNHPITIRNLRRK